ncbi:MAG: hypothetical protein E6J77_05305 [Deltaproteobacteria bacterium]|nr:MAG: hypothetical protein E6J77_05305 [Deltaproteobacteria bacterium]
MRPGCWPTCCASRGGRGAASMSDAAEPGRTRLLAWARLAITLVVLGGAWAFLVSNFRPSLIFLNTMTGGGDTPSYHHPIEHLRDVLLPAGNPQGWDLGNFAGYAPYQFYFLPPSLAIVGLGTIIPINIAFKLITVSGTFLLPLASLLALRGLGYGFPVPALGAVASLAFLFNEGNSMWGGNIPSTLAGEFAFSLAFGLAVIFFGGVYRGIETGRGWRTLAVVLALAGLCHPVAFLNATVPPLFFLLDRQRFARNLRYLLRVYVTAVLLMGFWLFPLMAKIGYATSINWTWHFQSWREILPKVLQPIAVLAALDALWVIVRPTPATRAGRYVLFGIVVTAIAFYNATSVGLPEIRFAPFAQFLMILLAIDLVARLLGQVRAAALPALALAAGTVAWVNNSVTYIPQWIKWNYEGIEKKATYPTLMQLMNALKGKPSDPRIAYENSPQYERFGSMRIFESLPLHLLHPVGDLGGRDRGDPGLPVSDRQPPARHAPPRPLQRPGPPRDHAHREGRARQGPALGAHLRSPALRHLPSQGRRSPLRPGAALPSGRGRDQALETGLPPLVRDRHGARGPDRRGEHHSGRRSRALPAHQPLADRPAARAARRQLHHRRARR